MGGARVGEGMGWVAKRGGDKRGGRSPEGRGQSRGDGARFLILFSGDLDGSAYATDSLMRPSLWAGVQGWRAHVTAQQSFPSLGLEPEFCLPPGGQECLSRTRF